MPQVNLSLKDAISLKPIDEDTYPATVMECGDVAEGPKAHYVPVKLAISEGEHEGRTFINNLPIEGAGAGIFVDFINKVMGTDHDVDDMDELAFDTDDLIGGELMIIIKNEEYPKGSGDIRSGIKSTARKTD